jgi:hypothetical protein
MDVVLMSRDGELCWHWQEDWAMREDPIPAIFQEVARFERPCCSQFKRQQADIVCGVEFSPDGHFLASAGVAKQVTCIILRNFVEASAHKCC